MEQKRINELVTKGINYEIEKAECKIKMAKRILFDRANGISDKSPRTDDEIQEIANKNRKKINSLCEEKSNYLFFQE